MPCGKLSRAVNPKAACRAKSQPEELQLISADSGRLFQQLHAALAHFRILLLGEEFEAVGHGPDRAQKVVAQPRTEQAGKFDGIDLHSYILKMAANRRAVTFGPRSPVRQVQPE